MKTNIDFTGLEIEREQMESLYRTRPEAERAVRDSKNKYDRDAYITEVVQSVEGRPAQDFYKVIYK